jgi:uncharacterized integral membrane protein
MPNIDEPKKFSEEKSAEGEKTDLSWEPVERYLSEKTMAGNSLAIIETEKIFTKVLEKLNFPGKTTDQKVRGLKRVISNFDELLQARKIYQGLISDVGFSLEKLDVKSILTSYYKAIEDITRFYKDKKDPLKKIKIYFNVYFPRPKKTLKKAILGFILFFFTVFLLDSTNFGKAIVSFFVSIAHFIFSWVLFTVLIIGGVIIIVLGSIFYFESRKKKGKLRIEE